MTNESIIMVATLTGIVSGVTIGGHWIWKKIQKSVTKSERTPVPTEPLREKKHKKRVTSGERIDIVQKGGPYAVNVEISAQGRHCNVTVNGARVETRAHLRHPNRNIRKVK